LAKFLCFVGQNFGVLENIHTVPKEGHQKFGGGGGGQRPQFFKEKDEAKLEFPEQWRGPNK